jgi:GntR family transcriptional regulator
MAAAEPRPPRPAPDGGGARAPKYAALRDWLAEEIRGGVIPRGAKLPSETALGRRFRVSRVTVRHALEALRDAGLVESRQGQGHFARPVKISLEIGRLHGLGEILRQQGIASTSEVLSLEEVEARPSLRRELQLAAPESVVRLIRLRRIDGTPVCLETRFIRADIGRLLLARDLAAVELCRLYEKEFGVEIGYAHVSIDHVAASAVAAETMSIAKGTELMRLRHLVFEGTQPVELCERLCLSGMFEITARAGRW